MLTMTDNAVLVIRDLAAQEDVAQDGGLRIAADADAGSLTIELVPEPAQGDHVVDTEGPGSSSTPTPPNCSATPRSTPASTTRGSSSSASPTRSSRSGCTDKGVAAQAAPTMEQRSGFIREAWPPRLSRPVRPRRPGAVAQGGHAPGRRATRRSGARHPTTRGPPRRAASQVAGRPPATPRPVGPGRTAPAPGGARCSRPPSSSSTRHRPCPGTGAGSRGRPRRSPPRPPASAVPTPASGTGPPPARRPGRPVATSGTPTTPRRSCSGRWAACPRRRPPRAPRSRPRSRRTRRRGRPAAARAASPSGPGVPARRWGARTGSAAPPPAATVTACQACRRAQSTSRRTRGSADRTSAWQQTSPASTRSSHCSGASRVSRQIRSTAAVVASGPDRSRPARSRTTSRPAYARAARPCAVSRASLSASPATGTSGTPQRISSPPTPSGSAVTSTAGSSPGGNRERLSEGSCPSWTRRAPGRAGLPRRRRGVGAPPACLVDR